MKTRSSWAIALLAIAFVPSLGACAQVRPFMTSCKSDNEVPAKDRESIGRVALGFVRDALGPDPSAAYQTFTAEAKQGIPREQFVSGLQNRIQPMGPFKNLKVTHTYLAEVRGSGQEQRVVCGNSSSPEGWVAVAAKPGSPEAHVIVEGQTVNNTHVFVLRLRPEQEDWRVQYIHFATAGMAAKSSDDLRRMAETERQRQHPFNAFLLYVSALQLSDRGPFLQLGIRPEIEKGMRDLPRPSILEGPFPLSWTSDHSTFQVMSVGPIAVGGKVYLVVDHEIDPWTENTVADRKNRDLIAALPKAYPEYKGVFAGLVIRAHERGGHRGFSTVDENQK